jgi:hypothetical protein
MTPEEQEAEAIYQDYLRCVDALGRMLDGDAYQRDPDAAKLRRQAAESARPAAEQWQAARRRGRLHPDEAWLLERARTLGLVPPKEEDAEGLDEVLKSNVPITTWSALSRLFQGYANHARHHYPFPDISE